MYRQGDVLIVKASIPKKAKKREGHNKILVHGELTGHSHRLASGEIYSLDGTLYFRSGNTELIHEEHDTIHIPEGEYRVIRQREYDEGEIRYVAD